MRASFFQAGPTARVYPVGDEVAVRGSASDGGLFKRNTGLIVSLATARPASLYSTFRC